MDYFFNLYYVFSPYYNQLSIELSLWNKDSDHADRTSKEQYGNKYKVPGVKITSQNNI